MLLPFPLTNKMKLLFILSVLIFISCDLSDQNKDSETLLKYHYQVIKQGGDKEVYTIDLALDSKPSKEDAIIIVHALEVERLITTGNLFVKFWVGQNKPGGETMCDEMISYYNIDKFEKDPLENTKDQYGNYLEYWEKGVAAK